MTSEDTNFLSFEAQFWGHYHNLKMWVEHDYDTRLLHRNLAFPLLKKLTELGDPIARRVFKEEIVQRFSIGSSTVQKYLFNQGYLNFLTPEELDTLNSDPYLMTMFEGKDIPIIEALTLFKLQELTSPGFYLNDLDELLKKFRAVNDVFYREKEDNLWYGKVREPFDWTGYAQFVVKNKRVRTIALKDPLNCSDCWYYIRRNMKEEGTPPPSKEKCEKCGTFIIPDSLGYLSRLEKLFIASNKDHGYISIPKTIENLKSLRSLVIGGNKITGYFSSIFNLTSLEHLNLKATKLEQLPEAIGNLKNLKV